MWAEFCPRLLKQIPNSGQEIATKPSQKSARRRFQISDFRFPCQEAALTVEDFRFQISDFRCLSERGSLRSQIANFWFLNSDRRGHVSKCSQHISDFWFLISRSRWESAKARPRRPRRLHNSDFWFLASARGLGIWASTSQILVCTILTSTRTQHSRLEAEWRLQKNA